MQIIVKLTTACNLACVYCSEGERAVAHLPWELFTKLIAELPPLLAKCGEKKVEILWHGGEPLLVGTEWLSKAMSYARVQLAGYEVEFLCQTNGTLIDATWIEVFQAYHVKVGISLDGYEELHDKNRRDKNGEPTFAKIMHNIAAMRQQDLEVGTLMVLDTAEAIDAQKLYTFIKENKLYPKIHPVIACGRAEGREVEQVYQNYLTLMQELLHLSLADDDTVVIEPLNSIMDGILLRRATGECSFSGTCGHKFLCLQADGTVGFCGRALAEDGQELMYGNLREKSLLELYYSQQAEAIRQRDEYLRTHDCKSCSYWELCHGGCSFEAVFSTGKLLTRYPHCAWRQQLLKFCATEGLELLKKKMIRRRRLYRELIAAKRQLLEEVRHACQ